MLTALYRLITLYENSPTAIITTILVIDLLLSFAVIFLERKSPSATLAWLMVINLLPGLGIFLYFFLSQNITRQKLFKRSRFEMQKAGEDLSIQMDDMAYGRYRHMNPEGEKWKDLIYLNQVHAMAFYSQNNDVRIFTEGRAKFDQLVRDLEAAEKFINMEYFIMKPDDVGLRILRVLRKKAEEGVEVRLLLDAMGSRQIKEKHLKGLKAAGGKVAFFFPANVFKIQLKPNYRNHRKLVIIDEKVAYVGGLNVASEYEGRSTKFNGWRDTHLRLVGGCVEDVDDRFLLDWRYASGEDFHGDDLDYKVLIPAGSSGVQIVSCGPDSPEEEIKRLYLKMITSAKKSVCVQTPYFIPDQSIFEALKTAALSGIDVRLMIPNKPDHPFVYWVTYNNAASLMESGVKVYIYNKGFLHSKCITVDDEVSSVGSANFDIRSFKLNFECNAVVYDKDVARRLHNAFLRDMDNSIHMTPVLYAQRPWTIKLKENVGRLISDIL
ncbi:MAG: cardiolipin synthase [Firmicutes bacterium]|nr:cardiolipin synthase [Bacillota bacterium]